MVKYFLHFIQKLTLREEGCEVLPIGNNSKFAISSGDRVGVTATNDAELAVEIKCPKPGKVHCTDVYYQLPIYYSLQVLAEMASKGCKEFINLCYNPNSSTVITGSFDEHLWNEVMSSTQQLLGGNQPSKPTRLDASTGSLKESVKEFCQASLFAAELPNLRGKPCQCNDQDHSSRESPFCKHLSNTTEASEVQCEFLSDICERAVSYYDEAYNILRRPAKEVIVAIMSDLNRNNIASENHHAVPVAYYLAGFSRKMEAVRGIIGDLITSAVRKELEPKVIAFDGQFLEIATQDDAGNPLTLLKLQKKVWQEVRSMSRREILDKCIDMCAIQNVAFTRTAARSMEVQYDHKNLYVQKNFKDIVDRSVLKKEKSSERENDVTAHDEEADIILQHLPPDLIERLDDDSLALIRSASQNVKCSTSNISEEPSVPVEKCSLATVLDALRNSKQGAKFKDMTHEKLESILQTAEAIDKGLTCQDLRIILRLNSEKCGSLKADMVAHVSQLYGDGSHINKRPRSPGTLRVLAKKALSGLRTIPLAVLYANNVFDEKL